MSADAGRTIDELDRVALTAPQPLHGLDVGDLGTVVALHDGGRGYTVEFVSLTGESVAILTLPADCVRSLHPREVAHARPLA